MAGKGMGMATKGGGCVAGGGKGGMVSETSKKTGPVMMKKGGMAKSMKSMKGMKGMSGVKMMRKGGMCD